MLRAAILAQAAVEAGGDPLRTIWGIPEPLFQFGAAVVVLLIVIVAMLKYGLPHLVAQIERERQVASERHAAAQTAWETHIKTIQDHHQETIQTMVSAWTEGFGTLHHSVQALDSSVQAQTGVLQTEMDQNRREWIAALKETRSA